jgi:tetratricopeptide (TPR) repeat protein
MDRGPVAIDLLSPLEALTRDFSGRDASALDPVTRLWVDVGVYLWRIEQLPRAEVKPGLLAAGQVIRAARADGTIHPGSHPAVPDTTGDADSTERELLAVAFESAADPMATAPEQRGSFAGLICAGAASLERVGAFRTAYTLLRTFRLVFPMLPDMERARIIVQQGRISRQLGALEDAQRHYSAAERLAKQSGDEDVRIRARMGHAVIASMRGNYPRARRAFRQALRAARKAGFQQHETAAHHGLLAAAVAAHDVDAAFVHGWHAFRDTVGEADARAEILNTLGELASLSGYPAAALSAYLKAIELSNLDRVRLPAIGGAALAAARVGQRELIDALASRCVAVAASSQQPYENAYALLEIAEAYAAVDAPLAARRFLGRVAALAEGGGFHELAIRAEQLDRALDRSKPVALAHARSSPGIEIAPRARAAIVAGPNAMLTERSREVIRALETLGPDSYFERLAVANTTAG